ncbi:MAG: ABC transporter permease [Hyphomicrobiaceae bacterium]
MTMADATQTGWTAQIRASRAYRSLRNSPLTVVAAVFLVAIASVCLFAPLIAPSNPYDLSRISLMNSLVPPAWSPGGSTQFLLGTDDQGRDLLSSIIYGCRLSLQVGVAAVTLAAVLGVALGLVSGYVGGVLDAVIMRAAEIQLSFPAILIALLFDGIARGLAPPGSLNNLAIYVVIFSLGFSTWPQYARTVRASTMVEATKDYVQAAQIIGRSRSAIMILHVLPNVLGPVLVIATIHLAIAIILEATLSFLGVGLPPTEPSLGTLLRIGNQFLFSGEWWITIFPALTLALLVLSVNVLGDWLRDLLDPKVN